MKNAAEVQQFPALTFLKLTSTADAKLDDGLTYDKPHTCYTKMGIVKNSRHVRLLVFLALDLLGSSIGQADRLHHKDGTTIEGRIVAETAEKIQIDTKYGLLNYDRFDITSVERSAAAVQSTAATAPLNLMQYVPKGPINPMNPPKIPLLVTLAPRPLAADVVTTGTTSPR